MEASAEAQVEAATSKFCAAIVSAVTEGVIAIGGAVVQEKGLNKRAASIETNVKGSESAASDIRGLEAGGENPSLSKRDQAEFDREHTTVMNATEKILLRGRATESMAKSVAGMLSDGMNITTAQDEKNAKLLQAAAEAYGKRADYVGQQMAAFLAQIVQILEMLTSESANHGQAMASTAVKA